MIRPRSPITKTPDYRMNFSPAVAAGVLAVVGAGLRIVQVGAGPRFLSLHAARLPRLWI